jgi:hypothetical protein
MNNKNYNISFILFFSIVFSTIIFNSCEKNDEVIKKQEANIPNRQNYKLPPELKVDLEQKVGLLIFKNRKQFDKITNLLMTETENYINSYFSKFDKNATVDEVNKQVDEDNFNPNLVYEKFEKYHSINSLRSKLVKLENEWLDNEKLIGEDPSIYPLSERCLPIANINGEYQIGKSIYRVEKTGTVYEIKNADYSALKSIRKNPNHTINNSKSNSNIVVHRLGKTENQKSTMDNCLAYVRQTDWERSGKHKMRMILDLDWDGYGSAAKAKTKAYRKKKKLFGGYRWGREWCAMSAKVYVEDFTHGCTYQKTYEDSKYRRWAYYVSVHVYAGGHDGGWIIRTKKGGHFHGYFATASVDKTYFEW